MNDERPDGATIRDLKAHLGSLWATAREHFEVIDSYIHRTYDVWDRTLYPDRPYFRPSTPAAILAHAADNQLAYEPHISVEPSGRGGKEARENADQMEKFLTAVFKDSSMMEMTLPFKGLGRYLLSYGYGVLEGPKLDLSEEPRPPERHAGEGAGDWAEREEAYEQARRVWNPFRLMATHPTWVLLDPTEKRPTVAVKSTQRYAGDLERVTAQKTRTRRTARLYTRPAGASAFTLVSTDEYWSLGWHSLAITGEAEPLFIERNPWGFVPFTHAFGGFGQERVGQGAAEPANLTVSLIEHILDDIKMQAQQVSSNHNMQIRASWAPMGVDPSIGAAEAGKQFAGGKMLEGKEGDYWVLKMQEMAPWMFQIGDETLRDIELGTYASAMRGGREQGVVTVGQQMLLSGAASRKFLEIQAQMEDMASIAGARILALVEVYGRELTVRGVKLGPEQVKGNRAVRVRFRLVDPVLQQQEKQVGMREVELGLRSPEGYRRDLALIENETEEFEAILRGKLYNLPPVQMAAMLRIAKDEGLEKVLRDFEKQGADGQAPIGEPGS